MSKGENSTLIYLKKRAKTHGDFRHTAGTAQALKEIVAESAAGKLSPIQHEALDMICSKIARICCGDNNEPDHWLDVQGYAKLAEDEIND
jgi:hypothetical protein